MHKWNIVIINVYRPPDYPAEKFISPLSEKKNKTKINRKSKAKYHIYRRPELSNYWLVNGNIGGWNTRKSGSSKWRSVIITGTYNAYGTEFQRENITYSMPFSLTMTNSPHIIITKTSMSDHNINQIETNIKILEEKQKKTKKRNLSYMDLNFFNEDISWASIDADLFNTSREMLLTDVNTDEMRKIIINNCLEICKTQVLPKKTPRKHQIPRDRRAIMRKRF